MKKIVIPLIICVKILLAGWWPQGAPSDTDYIKLDIAQGLSDYRLWTVAYDNPNNKGLILRSGCGSVVWQHYPTQFDQDYRFTDVTGCYSDLSPWAIVVGYKTAEPDKHKGIILRGTDTGFEDITSNIPSNFPCRQSPTPFLSVSRYPLSPDKIIVTGGFGTILISTDNGETWAYTTGHPNSDPEDRLSDWYYSSDWSTEYYPYPILICGDNSGLLAWSYNDGVDWQTKDFPEYYEITDYGTYDGRLTPLDVQDYACGMSFGYVAVGIPEWEKEQISYDNNNNAQNWWWWHSAACHQYGLYEIIYAQWFVGSDGGILRCDSATLDYENCHWERQPDNDSFYNLNTLGFGVYDDLSYYYYYGHTLGSKGRNLMAQFNYSHPGNVDNPTVPSDVQDPGIPQNFTMVYDPVYQGYRMYWDPPEDYDLQKVAAYWVCPPGQNGDVWWIANKAPIPRTTYFLAWPVGEYLAASVSAMRRDGQCGDWSSTAWNCALDKTVDAEATGRNNARRLVYGDNTFWAFWQKNNEIYVASSVDTGKTWIYRSSTPPSLGNGEWPAAGLDNNDNPVVCWIENIVNGSRVTARIYYRRYNTGEWESSYILKEETFTGSGYLNPSVSVDENNHVHIVYGKLYNGNQDWQVWYGEFPVNDPGEVDWHLLDYQSGEPEASNKLLPTIGTDRYSKPMVIWNRPNSSSFYFAYRDDEDEWHTRILDFTGTMPCLEVKGTTAYLTYVNSGDIWYSTGGTGGFGRPKRISNTLGASSAPVIANNIIVWEEHVDNDYEIYYSYLQDDLKWTKPEKVFGYAYLPDRMPQIVYLYPLALVTWTQRESNRIVCFSQKEIKSERGDGPASMAYDLGDETPSPILVQRTGYIEYGQEPGKIIDIGSDALEYHIVGLDNEYSWKGRVLFYHQSNQPIICRLILNNNQPIIVSIPPNQIIEKTYEIPEVLIINEELNFTIEPIGNSNVVISGMLLYSKPKQGSGGGTQSQNEQIITTSTNLQCNPVIFNKATEISYSLRYKTDIQLSVYNSIGQLVIVIDKGSRAGNQVFIWNPKDRHGKKLSSGIYFLQLKTPETSDVKKMVILE